MSSYVKGTYIQNIYASDTGYTVGLFKVLETNDEELIEYKNRLINFVGTFANIKEKNNYIFRGNCINHPRYGFQYSVLEYEVVMPEENDELITFLSSELFPIGEKTAIKIVEKFKENTLPIILDNPRSLLLIPRITEVKAMKIHDTLVEYQASSHIILELTKMGFSSKQSFTIFNKYQNETLEKVNLNIYNLIDDFLDFNFKEVDDIALKSGISLTDDRRMNAFVIYTMEKLCFEKGNTYLSLDDILMDMEFINAENLEYLMINLVRMGKIVIEDERYYLKKFYDAEKYIANFLINLNNKEDELNKGKIKKYIDYVSRDENINYDDIQKDAIYNALVNKFTIITGGPGTGKTTIVKAIVSVLINYLDVKDKDIALLAPTGRASKKMCEKMNISASTIHRFLKWNKETNDFNINEYEKAMQKYIIVDEVSMIDVSLMEALVKGLKKDVRLILVGDYNQLPSVREGQVLKDLIDSNAFKVIKLTSLYRQNENSYIVKLASEIKDKNLSKDFATLKDDYNFIKSPGYNVSYYINEIIDKALLKGYTKDDIQVLAPMYKGENGIDNLNKILQEKINPASYLKKELKIGDIIYRQGDKVLQLVNSPDDNIFNGDIGYIEDILTSKESKTKRNEIIINFDGNKVSYTQTLLNNIRHGYAISVHKSQGSEFKMVIIPFVNSFKRMLYNKLIYTAVTRAKSYLIIVGEEKAFIDGINNDYIENRKTTLKKFITDKYNLE